MVENKKDKLIEQNIKPLFFNLDKEIDISSIKKKKDKKKIKEQAPNKIKENLISEDIKEIEVEKDITTIDTEETAETTETSVKDTHEKNESVSYFKEEEDSIFFIKDIDNEEVSDSEYNNEDGSFNQEEKAEERPEEYKPQSKRSIDKTKVIVIAGVVCAIFLLVFSMSFLTKMIINKTDAPTEVEVVEDTESKKAEDIVVERVKEIVSKAHEKTKVINLPTTSVDGEKDDRYFTYNNDYYGISFKYPSNWIENYQFQIKKTSDNVKNIVLLTHPPEDEELDNMRITVEYTKKSITAKEYIRQTEEKMKQIFPELTIVNTGEITVSGREAPTRVYIWVPEEELAKSEFPQEWKRIQQYQVYVSGNNKMYIVTFTGSIDGFSKNYEKYEKILDTLVLGD